MKQIFNILVYSLFMMVIGLFVWTVIPDGQVEREFTINPGSSLFSEKIGCEEIQNLLSTKYTLIFPKSIRFGESGVVQVDIEKTMLQENKINTDHELEACGISLEVWVDSRGVIVKPGNKIINPYLDVQSMLIKFEIIPINDQLVKGTIWISAVFPGKTKSILDRIPIFAIPITIQIRSLFGVPVRTLKILSSFLIIFGFVLVILQKVLEGKRK